MSNDAAEFWWHSAAVETYRGTGSFGDGFAAPVTVEGMLDDTRQLVVSATGEQVVSESTFNTDLENADLFTVDSRVTVNGRTTRVLGTKRLDSAGFTSLDHLQVTLR